MRTLEAVRELLFQPSEEPPAEVLRSAREELVRLSSLVDHAKNVLQRNGAKKKLAELQPLIPALEIEVGLTALEQLIADRKNGAQRAAARVQCQRLASQISALPAGEEKDVFQQWLAELHPSPDSTRPSFEVSPAAVVETPATPSPDAGQEIQNLLSPLVQAAQIRPIADPAHLRRESDVLARRIAELPAGEERVALEAGINSITTALGLDEEFQSLSKAVAALEEMLAQKEVDLPRVVSVQAELTARVARLSGPETLVLREKLGAIETALTVQQERKEIEAALEHGAAELQKSPSYKNHAAQLASLAERIGRVKNVNDRAIFLRRIETLQTLVRQRQEEADVSAALDVIHQQRSAPNAALPALQTALKEVDQNLQRLPPGEARTNLEKRIVEERTAVEALQEKAMVPTPRPAVVLRLEPVVGSSMQSIHPLIFVARDRFSIGRKPENEPPRADLLTSSSELRISRIHVTFLARQRQIQVLAGEEGKPSTNPALVDETELSGTPVAISFERERRIDLTGVLRLRAKLIPSASPFGPPSAQENGIHDSTTVVMPPIAGALRFRPEGEDKLAVTAVWIFTDATIGAHPNCAALVPLSGIAPEQVRIHFWRKSFWIESLRRDSFVQLAGKPLIPGTSQPLFPDQELRLGNVVYKVQLS